MDAKRWRRAVELVRASLAFTQHHEYRPKRLAYGLCDCGVERYDAAALRFLNPEPPYPEVEQPV